MRNALNENPVVQLVVIGLIGVVLAFMLFSTVLKKEEVPASDPAAAVDPSAAAPFTPVDPSAAATAPAAPSATSTAPTAPQSVTLRAPALSSPPLRASRRATDCPST